MKAEGRANNGPQDLTAFNVVRCFFTSSFILHPSSFILHPSSFILHPSSFILHPSSFILHPCPSSFILALHPRLTPRSLPMRNVSSPAPPPIARDRKSVV